ncbi:MAG: glutamyl-tRNA reductase [Candidatus Eremiobacteraeota bacterium]|nr:glutamyl-tRNA reductase [Candidatus Eremiobacteraeota bacterium]
MDHILLIGINHKNAPVEIREIFSFGQEGTGLSLRELAKLPLVAEGALLSTCNRTEFYLVSPEGTRSPQGYCRLLCRLLGVPWQQVRAYFYFQKGAAAVTHLFSVASGLDSMIKGESQILGQVKQALAAARESHAALSVINKLFLGAIRTGKRARAETGINQGFSSVSSAAVAFAVETLGTLCGKKVLLIGAGTAGTLALRAVVQAGAGKIYLANRTYEKARILGKKYKVKSLHIEEVGAILPEVDVVISSAAAPFHLITESSLQAALPLRKPLLLIDLAVPRSIDPLIGHVEGATLYNIDDLGATSGRFSQAYDEEKIYRIMEEEKLRFFQFLSTRKVVPLIKELKRQFEEIRTLSLSRISLMYKLDDKERRAFEKLYRKIMHQALHRIITGIKDINSGDSCP